MRRIFPRSIPPGPLSAAARSERSEWPLDPGDFAAYHRYAPSALALRECLRLRAVRGHTLDEPILDIGCGDGVFAELAFPGKQIWGIDVNPTEIGRAQATAAYSTLVCGSITEASLPPGFFRGAIANCSLEHVPDLDRALSNISGALVPGAQFILIVPTPNWTSLLAIPEMLNAAGLTSLAAAYGAALDDVFHHHHLYDEQGWTERLERAGFAVRDTAVIASRRSSWMFDILLYPSLIGLGTKKLTGRWVLAPALRSLTVDITRRLLDALAERIGDSDSGSEYLIVAERAP